MSYNIVKTMKDKETGKTINVLLLDGNGDEILEIKKLDKALDMAHILNTNSDSNWEYSVRGNGKTYDEELAVLTHKKKK